MKSWIWNLIFYDTKLHTYAKIPLNIVIIVQHTTHTQWSKIDKYSISEYPVYRLCLFLSWILKWNTRPNLIIIAIIIAAYSALEVVDNLPELQNWSGAAKVGFALAIWREKLLAISLKYHALSKIVSAAAAAADANSNWRQPSNYAIMPINVYHCDVNVQSNFFLWNAKKKFMIVLNIHLRLMCRLCWTGNCVHLYKVILVAVVRESLWKQFMTPKCNIYS